MPSLFQKMWDFIFGTDKNLPPISPKIKLNLLHKGGEHKTDDAGATKAN